MCSAVTPQGSISEAAGPLATPGDLPQVRVAAMGYVGPKNSQIAMAAYADLS